MAARSAEQKVHAVPIMQVQLLKSKIHRAQITAGNLNYEGSLTVDRLLMEKVGLLPHEKILAGNLANGRRFETYVIPGEPGSGAIILNGATSLLGKPGDRLTIMSFAWLDELEAGQWHPRVIVLGEHNQIINHRGL
jgi:aspartate 1-decarboxylase